jgi:hypothetical protein
MARSTRFQRFILQHISGEDAEDGDAPPRKPRVTTFIAARLRGTIVCEPVYLDRQAGRRTIKIENIRSDRVLPAHA